jgi:hypothetical protein
MIDWQVVGVVVVGLAVLALWVWLLPRLGKGG